jgi:hypothetical protein
MDDADLTPLPDRWPPDLLYLHLHGEIESARREMAAMRDMLDERYRTQTKALDAAFLAQQTAMATAFLAADKAVQAALLAAEKAVQKAESAANERFAAVNEFRAQLSDQTATFIPRLEAESRFEAIGEKLSDALSRLDVASGRGAGTLQLWGYIIGAGGLVAAVITTLYKLSGK